MDWNKLNNVEDWNDLDKMISEDRMSPDEKREWKKTEKGEDGKAVEDPSSKPTTDSKSDNAPVFDWADMKQYDDDHDQDWFEQEEQRLGELYGGNFIKVKYTEQGRPGYFCEICMAEMNAKKSLETHCEGMKHLKKKSLWEKNKLEGNNSDDAETENKNGPTKKRKLPGPNEGGNRVKNPNKEPLGRRLGGFVAGDNFDSPFNYGAPGAIFTNRGSLLGAPENSFGGRETKFGGRGSSFGGQRGGLGGGQRGILGAPPDDYFGPRDDYGPRGGPSAAARSGLHDDIVPIHLPDMEKLHGGTTGMLLKKLASCYMKDQEDADLATSVIGALASSLREFYMKHKQPKVAELLMEAELKLNTMKAFKAGQSEGQNSVTISAPFRPNIDFAQSSRGLGRNPHEGFGRNPHEGFGRNRQEFGPSSNGRGFSPSNPRTMSEEEHFGVNPMMASRNPNFMQGPQRNSFHSNRGLPMRGRGGYN